MTYAHTLWCATVGGDSDDCSRERRTFALRAEQRRAVHMGEDAAVVAGVRAGDAACFDRLVTQYWAGLCGFAAGYVKDPERAQEIVADVFAVLWERRAAWEIYSTVEAYLFGAVRNKARTAHRDLSRRSALLREAVASGEAAIMPTPMHAPDADLDMADRVQRVHAAVDALPIRLREATILRWERYMDYDEIASVLGVSPAGARQLVSRALKQLRTLLGA